MIGATLGSLVSGTFSDRYGRKPIILVSAVLYTVGAIIMALTPSISVLMIGRFVVGLGIGASSQIVPLYLSEVAPIKVRGQMVALNTLAITFGQFLAAITSFLLRPHWRWMLGVIAILSAAYFFGMICMPESPRWLGKVG